LFKTVVLPDGFKELYSNSCKGGELSNYLVKTNSAANKFAALFVIFLIY